VDKNRNLKAGRKRQELAESNFQQKQEIAVQSLRTSLDIEALRVWTAETKP